MPPDDEDSELSSDESEVTGLLEADERPRLNLLTIATALAFLGLLIALAMTSQAEAVAVYLAVLAGVVGVGVGFLILTSSLSRARQARLDGQLRIALFAALIARITDTEPSEEELLRVGRLTDAVIEAMKDQTDQERRNATTV